MSSIHSYKDLIVWQKSMVLVNLIYKLTSAFPKSEQFGLTNQIRRAAVSIPSNLAEGYARKTKKDTIHFHIMAYGSALELETQLQISKDLGFVTEGVLKQTEDLLLEVIKMLNKMTSNVR